MTLSFPALNPSAVKAEYKKRLFFEMNAPIKFYMNAQTICFELPCWLIWKENLFSFSLISALRISLLVDLERVYSQFP